MTEITYTQGDTFWLNQKGWKWLAHKAINSRLEWGVWMYKGDKQEAEKLLEQKQAEILQESKGYYSQAWV